MKKIQILLFALFSFFWLQKLICQGVPAEDLFLAYTQDNANNCASIALIKANLNVFGLTGLYKEKYLKDNLFEYTLKDNSKVVITTEELALARQKFNVNSSNAHSNYLISIVNTSIVCYAIMAKLLPREFPYFSSKTYEGDLALISDVSFDVRFGINLLGTGDFFVFLKRYGKIRGKDSSRMEPSSYCFCVRKKM